MIYRSNLVAPDLTPNFKHLISRPMGHSFGHDVLSDWADKADDDPVFGIWKKCGLFTLDEAAILYNICYRARGGPWADIGAHTGWTSAYIKLGVYNGSQNMPIVECVDPVLAVPEFLARFEENMRAVGQNNTPHGVTSAQFWSEQPNPIASAVIDGDHDSGKPLEDAKAWADHTERAGYRWRGVAVFHDFWGEPVQEAVTWLMNQGFKARIYKTPHGVAACWRGEFTPPDHIPDPNLPDLRARCHGFDFTRCV